MGLKNIEKSSFFYQSLYHPLVILHNLYYRRFKTRGDDRIPKKTPVIFLANHQNALMDALAILFGVGNAIVFLARADIFKNKRLASILFFLKLMPIFRPRDGKENMSQNDATFQRSVEVLQYNRPMAMFPEGTFNPYKNLLPFKKGFARIAFMSEEATGWNLNLHIVPLGIDYSDKRRRYSETLVQFGNPIHLAQFREEYEVNPAHAYNLLMSKVRDGMLEVMINIDEPEVYHQTHMRIFEMCEKESLSDKSVSEKLYRRFVWQQNCANKLNVLATHNRAEMDSIKSDVGYYYSELKREKVSDKMIRNRSNRFVNALFNNVVSLLILLIYPFMALPHILPLLSAKIVLPKIKDPQFISSIKFVTWFVASTIYYPLMLILFCCLTDNLLYKILFLPALILHGIIAQWMTPRVRCSGEYFRSSIMPKAKYNQLNEKRIEIMNNLKKHLLVGLLLLAILPLSAQEKSKEGFSFGVLPTVAFDADLGFQYGGLVNLYDYRRPAKYPDYGQMWKVEVSRFTKGSGVNQVYYDSKKMFGGKMRLIANFSYLTEQRLDFYGFNGYQSRLNFDFTDKESSDYKTRVFYGHERNQLRIQGDLIGALPVKGMQWLAGVGIFNTKVATVDIAKLNKGKSGDDLLPDEKTLYDKYVDWGLISDKEKDGGYTNYLKIGALYDTRDIEANPSKGIWAEATLTYAPSFLFNQDNNYLKAEVSLRQYFTLVRDKLIFAYRLTYQGTLAGHTPFYIQPYTVNAYSPATKLDGLGGAKTLRGIARNRVVGDGFVYANAEMRWKFLNTVIAKQNVYFALHGFADAGMIVQDIKMDKSLVSATDRATYFDESYKNDKLHPSAGLGLRVALNENFILAVDYGMPFNKQDGKSGGLYINIGNLF